MILIDLPVSATPQLIERSKIVAIESIQGLWEGIDLKSGRIFRMELAESIHDSFSSMSVSEDHAYVYQMQSQKIDKGKIKLVFFDLSNEDLVLTIEGEGYVGVHDNIKSGFINSTASLDSKNGTTSKWDLVLGTNSKTTLAEYYCRTGQLVQEVIKKARGKISKK